MVYPPSSQRLPFARRFLAVMQAARVLPAGPDWPVANHGALQMTRIVIQLLKWLEKKRISPTINTEL
jgi:hypothetical protein